VTFRRDFEMTPTRLTCSINQEGDGFVSLCPELDIASQGQTVEEAHGNLREAVELFLECAHPTEIARRLSTQRAGR
jgi:predicted RNase H-like HicB family nuclease